MSNACKLTHRISSGLYEARHCKVSRNIFSAFLRFQLRARRYRFRQASVAYSKERPVSGPSAARRSWTWQFTHKFLSSTAVANLSETRRLKITKTRLLRSINVLTVLASQGKAKNETIARWPCAFSHSLASLTQVPWPTCSDLHAEDQGGCVCRPLARL